MVASVSDDATVRIWGPAPQYRGSGGRSGAGTSGNSSSTTANGLYTSHTLFFSIHVNAFVTVIFEEYYFD